MVWGILGALPEEVALLVQAMDLQSEHRHYGTTFYKGGLGGHPAVAACCSVGKVNAALCASVMIREMGADAVVNVGIAGAVDPRLKVLDVVLSSSAAFHDAESIMQQFYPFRLEFDADPGLLALARRACQSLSDDLGLCLTGRIATGDVFVQGGTTKQDIAHRLSPLCVEMEGAAVAQACYMNQVPFLIIRTISDGADDDAALTYDEFKDCAACQSATILQEMLRLSPP
jgi:adenosylhomocysteine nucleosidase